MNFKFYCLILLLSKTFSFSNDKLFFLKQISRDNSDKKLAEGKLKYMVDIDGTICSKTLSDYPKSKPLYDRIRIFNQLYSEGNEIHYWTSRGALSGKNWDQFTVDQLNSWNVLYTSINTAKPHYDVWIDDKAINIDDYSIDI